MNPERFLPLIDICPPLSQLSLEARRRLATVSREVEFEAGERMISAFRPKRRILILLEGWAKLIGITEDGIERILYVYGPCEIIGSRFLLEDSPESSYDVVAMEKAHALEISRDDFLAVAEDHPEVTDAVTGVLLERVDKVSSWLLAAMSVDASLRLTKLLLDLADTEHSSEGGFVPLRLSPTHETLAQIIGTTRPHTTTLLGALEEEGVIRRVHPRGILVRPSGLEQKLRDADIRPEEKGRGSGGSRRP